MKRLNEMTWWLDDVWPFGLETTGLIAMVAFTAYGFLLGWLVGTGQL